MVGHFHSSILYPASYHHCSLYRRLIFLFNLSQPNTHTHRHCAGVISSSARLDLIAFDYMKKVIFFGIWHENVFVSNVCSRLTLCKQSRERESNRGATTTRNTVCVVCWVLCVCVCVLMTNLSSFHSTNVLSCELRPKNFFFLFPSIQRAIPLFSRQTFSHDSTG